MVFHHLYNTSVLSTWHHNTMQSLAPVFIVEKSALKVLKDNNVNVESISTISAEQDRHYIYVAQYEKVLKLERERQLQVYGTQTAIMYPIQPVPGEIWRLIEMLGTKGVHQYKIMVTENNYVLFIPSNADLYKVLPYNYISQFQFNLNMLMGTSRSWIKMRSLLRLNYEDADLLQYGYMSHIRMEQQKSNQRGHTGDTNTIENTMQTQYSIGSGGTVRQDSTSNNRWKWVYCDGKLNCTYRHYEPYSHVKKWTHFTHLTNHWVYRPQIDSGSVSPE